VAASILVVEPQEENVMYDPVRRVQVLAALVVFAWPAFGGEDNPMGKATALARQRWKKHFRQLTPIKSPRLRALLGDCPIYQATVFNPISAIAGRPTFLHTLALRPDGPVFIERDRDAAALLSQCKAPTADPEAALSLALAFGELRNYNLETRVRAAGAAPRPQDWAILIGESKDGWSVGCTFLVDPNITFCRRYRIAITRSGQLTVQPGKRVFARGGYR